MCCTLFKQAIILLGRILVPVKLQRVEDEPWRELDYPGRESHSSSIPVLPEGQPHAERHLGGA
jgi:hypothetical protein